MRVLLIDDDPEILDLLSSFLAMKGYEVDLAETGRAGLEMFRKDRYSLVISDYMLPDIDGLEAGRQILSMDRNALIILITGHGSIESAVSAIKAGVFDYILKPFNLEQIEVAIHKAEKVIALRAENIKLREVIARSEGADNLIGRSRAMKTLKGLIRRVAVTQATVLITGESGTGKELVAKAIHRASHRAKGPFIPVNCGAIPDNLLEDELFGHKKGAFTDAVSDRAGRFEQAEGGTIFLDEIGNMSLSLQAKLLRVLQERTVSPLGSGELKPVDVRVIAATNLSLADEIKGGRFREDLFYRLNVIPIHIPPLRERTDDIPQLIDFFNRRFSGLMGFPEIRFSRKAMKYIFEYHWPGNIRQLENFVERMIVLQPEGHVVQPEDLPSEIYLGAGGNYDVHGFEGRMDLKAKLQEMERAYIEQALELSRGKRSEAARRLGLKRTTLIQKMKKLDIGEKVPKEE
ncbi:MAG: sigma-54-dependent Fis family transcriptional regulator [Acidobacteria bacterium]|nr:sigma-54-dependent Fis family transcriptional regulator [Acidobacteriota bacterium]